MSVKRSLSSFERKIGQKNLAESFGVSTSTVRRWKKKNKLPEQYKDKFKVFQLKMRHLKPTKKQKLRNKRFERLDKYQSIKEFQYTKTSNLALEIYDFNDIPKTLLELEKNKFKGQPYEYAWITLNALTKENEVKMLSTPAFSIDELLRVWQSEVDILMRDYSIDFIISITITGKAFHF
jgi:hypothetical protein